MTSDRGVNTMPMARGDLMRTGAKYVVAVATAVFVAGGVVVSSQPEWKAPADAKNGKNPSPKDPKVIAKGKKLGETNFATCHAPEGEGDGPAAASLAPPKPANWTTRKV